MATNIKESVRMGQTWENSYTNQLLISLKRPELKKLNRGTGFFVDSVDILKKLEILATMV